MSGSEQFGSKKKGHHADMEQHTLVKELVSMMSSGAASTYYTLSSLTLHGSSSRPFLNRDMFFVVKLQ